MDLCCFWAASVGLGVHALRSSVGRPNHPRSPSRPHPSRQESDTARGERSGYVQDGVTWDGAGPQEGAAPASASKVMLTWLLRGCVGYQLLTWLQVGRLNPTYLSQFCLYGQMKHSVHAQIISLTSGDTVTFAAHLDAALGTFCPLGTPTSAHLCCLP